MTNPSNYQEYVLAALMEYEQRSQREIQVTDANDFLETIFAILRPKDHSKWSEGKKVLEDEMEGYDEIVYEGESEEAYEIAGIDMEEIMQALRGE